VVSRVGSAGVDGDDDDRVRSASARTTANCGCTAVTSGGCILKLSKCGLCLVSGYLL
jgi:hypothetical protein